MMIILEMRLFEGKWNIELRCGCWLVTKLECYCFDCYVWLDVELNCLIEWLGVGNPKVVFEIESCVYIPKKIVRG